MNENYIFKGKWIWHNRTESKNGINQFIDFRKTFTLNQLPENITARIAADSHFELWINGTLIDWNQYPGWPQDRFYNTHNLSGLLKKGINCIAVRAQYRGEDFIIYAKGKAGMIFELEADGAVILSSGNDWTCRRSRVYKSGTISKMTWQARFNFEYNAQYEDDWQMPAYSENKEWSAALEIAGAVNKFWKPPQPRPVPFLALGKPKAAAVISTGTFTRKKENAVVAQTMESDNKTVQFKNASSGKNIKKTILGNNERKSLTLQPSPQGTCILFDLGAEESGYLYLDFIAPEGTVFDIAHGEYLMDGKVRCVIGARNFADRYIAKEGRNTWQYSFNRIGARYLQIHIPEIKKKITIFAVSVIPSQYPFTYHGNFSCADRKLNNLWKIGRRTLEICANEHYEDCPWREQALYGTDHRYQALYGYYTFGETALPAASWDLLGGGMNDDGLLELTAPGRLPVNIPSFTFHWISAVWELLLFSGVKAPAEKQFARICTILNRILEKRTDKGIIENFKGKRYWNLYEWTQGMDGNLKQYAGIIDENAESYDAMHNLIIIESLRSAAKIAEYIGKPDGRKYLKAADRIARAFHGMFWDSSKNCYSSFRRGGVLFHQSQFVQAYAVKENTVPSKKITDILLGRIAHSAHLSRAEMPSHIFIYDVLLSAGDMYESHVINNLHGTFSEMLDMGATSLWEVIGGEERFQCAGSLCHGWTAVCNYFAGRHVLGIMPLEPGFSSFSFSPHVMGLPHAEGIIPTPHGPITVKWRDVPEKNILDVEITYPKKSKIKMIEPMNRKIHFSSRKQI